jgi:adenosylhomocysteine nucleosidase
MNNTAQPAFAVVIISADIEWAAVCALLPVASRQEGPFGSWFPAGRLLDAGSEVIFLHGGWGKIAAAASAQYAIDHWRPQLLVNLGTCGGIRGRIERGEVLLVEQCVVYDIYEQMGDAEAHIDHYRTEIDLSWLPPEGLLPHAVRRGLIISADRDLHPGDIPALVARYDARAADWESGAIAWVAARNQTRLLILRGVSDLVDEQGGEAYGGLDFFRQAATHILSDLLHHLPDWLTLAA